MCEVAGAIGCVLIEMGKFARSICPFSIMTVLPILQCVQPYLCHVSKGMIGNTIKGMPKKPCASIRSFVCNTKRPSVKQSMKWQVSSDFQIYPGKTDPPFETARALSELFAVQCCQ